jgi:hypothetical protein
MERVVTLEPPDIVFITGYTCPGCGVDLEMPDARVDCWLRCPRCDRPSLPPEDPTQSAIEPWFARRSAPRRTAGGDSARRPGLIVAGVVFAVALAADLVVRSITKDEILHMYADVVAFATFSLVALLWLRSRSAARNESDRSRSGSGPESSRPPRSGP